MTKLRIICQRWNADQSKLYQPVLEALLANDITSDNVLLQKDLSNLCSITNIPRWWMRAFVRQIMLDTTVAQEIDKSSISEHTCLPTGFSSLDHALGGGLHFKNVIELCGKTNTGKTEFISNLLASYILHTTNPSVYIFGSTGSFAPKRMHDILQKHNIQTAVLSQIEFSQVFSIRELSLSLENLGALLAASTREQSLVIIEDLPSITAEINWMSSEIKHLTEIIKSLSKLQNMIIIQHNISKSNLQPKFETYWNPMIDLRLYFNKQAEYQRAYLVEILKTRYKASIYMCF
ncbi:hypothetical protein CU097_014368 [Rhizopus azygosporus]|uniref:Rad51-like C-terminal domain-containing protein n=1 Tax=Rhizopus azygosporus TaxID=86630 RepID=A0A367K4E9_RHIAZ|nr:hypothetical protein CU097_014368 [Rhizopus azygosporus]